MSLSCNPSRGILYDDGVEILRYHPTRSLFAEIALNCELFVVDSYDENEVTITHDDPEKSGAYLLEMDPTTQAQALPYVAEIRRVMREMNRIAYLNVLPAARVPIDDAEYISDADVIAFAKAMWGIIQVAVEEG